MIMVPYDLDRVIGAVNEGEAQIRYHGKIWTDMEYSGKLIQLGNSHDETVLLEEMDYHEAEFLFYNSETDEYDSIGNLEEANENNN